MHFPNTFKRRVGCSSSDLAELGSDKIPTDQPTKLESNQLQLRTANISGYPIQRIVVGLIGPDGPAPKASVYLYEDSTLNWFKTDDMKSLTNQQFVYFDIPVLADNANISHKNVGSLEVCIVVEKPENAVDGVYTFVVGGDVSNTA